jgi:predicted transcriptional regulator
MSSREAKSALFEAIALMGKGFASPVRLELLDLLAQAPRSVEELARASGQSTANTSQHLQALHAAGMVMRARRHARAVRARGRRGAAAVVGAA